MPGAVPSDFEERNRFLNYARDPVTPKNIDPLELGSRHSVGKR